jgi:hypothetical protein
MARGPFGIFELLQFFNIRENRLETSDSRGTFQGTHRLRGTKKQKFEVVRTLTLFDQLARL